MARSRSTAGKLAKNKGKVGEREVAHLLQRFGFDARRGQQFAGGGDSPDVVSELKGFHIEVKFEGKAPDVWKALVQAAADRKPQEQSLIFHRKNNHKWLVSMDAEEFLTLMQELYE